MDIPTLLRLITKLSDKTPGLAAFEAGLTDYRSDRPTWYKTQKEHLEGWLNDYRGPGAYGRQGGPGRDAQYFYNHFQCAPGLFWLAEAAGVSQERLKAASAAAATAGANYARQCAALRREIPWSEVAAALRRTV